MSHSQFTREQGYQIYAWKKESNNLSEVARNQGAHTYTISREFKRNQRQRDYRHKQASEFASMSGRAFS